MHCFKSRCSFRDSGKFASYGRGGSPFLGLSTATTKIYDWLQTLCELSSVSLNVGSFSAWLPTFGKLTEGVGIPSGDISTSTWYWVSFKIDRGTIWVAIFFLCNSVFPLRDLYLIESQLDFRPIFLQCPFECMECSSSVDESIRDYLALKADLGMTMKRRKDVKPPRILWQFEFICIS